MVKPQSSVLAFVVGAAILLTNVAVPAQEVAEIVSLHGKIDENVVAAGETVRVDAQVSGDVVSAGRTLAIGGEISDDILAAGRDVAVHGAVEGDVRIAGANLTTDARIGGDFMAAGHTITFPTEAAVGGNVWVAGHDANLFGSIGGNVRAAARNIRLAGEVGGDVELAGERLTIASTARIAGDLTYRSGDEATIEPGAEILGDVVFVRTGRPREWVGDALAGIAALGLTFYLGLFLLGALHILILPDAAAGAAKRIGRNPWRALGLGFVIILAGPLAIALLAASIIGIPIMIVLLACYVIAPFIGLMVAAGALGRLGARLIGRNTDISYWTRLAALAAGLLILTVVGFIPVIGPLAVILATAVGLGALVLHSRNASRLAVD